MTTPTGSEGSPADPTMSPDSDLIAQAAAGDHSAFHMLVERHRSMVYRVAYQFARDYAGRHHG